MDVFIQTYTGKKIYLERPEVDDIDIEDIAHGLSNTCRFAGQSTRFYSMAEHCLLVADQAPFEFKLEALLYDGSEAYIRDITSSLKSLLKAYSEIENILTNRIELRFNLRNYSNAIKEIDLRMLATERNVVFSKNILWGSHMENIKPYKFVPFEFLSPKEAKAEFLKTFKRLFECRAWNKWRRGMMAINSNIEWCNATWNPWRGCRKISEGCDNYYMFRDQRRFGLDPAEIIRSKTTFNDPLKWKDGRIIFTCSWSDFFIKEADEWRDEAWDIIRKTPQHNYQILTKRPARMILDWPLDWPLENIWLGVTVDNKKRGIPSIDILRNIPAKLRFLSIEPLLEDLGSIDLTGIDWVIIGGESGPRSRPMNPEWVTNIRDQCFDASVPFFFKQWGGVNKKQNGRMLEGEVWDQMPKNML